jgi:hypothetical protein
MLFTRLQGAEGFGIGYHLLPSAGIQGHLALIEIHAQTRLLGQVYSAIADYDWLNE